MKNTANINKVDFSLTETAEKRHKGTGPMSNDNSV